MSSVCCIIVFSHPFNGCTVRPSTPYPCRLFTPLPPPVPVPPVTPRRISFKVPVQSLPKFLGRIQACVGLGFVLGPMTMTILHRLFKVSTADTFYAAALFPLVGLFYALFRLEETKSGETGVSQLWKRRSIGGDRGRPSSSESEGPLVGPEADRRAKEGRDRALASRRRRRRREGAAGEAGGSADGGGDGYGYGYEYGDYAEDGTAEASEDAVAYDELQEHGAAAAAVAPTYRAAVVEEPGRAGAGARAAGAGFPGAMDRVVVGAVREVIPRAVMLLVGNGFLLMYAFSIETIYAMFLKVCAPYFVCHLVCEVVCGMRYAVCSVLHLGVLGFVVSETGNATWLWLSRFRCLAPSNAMSTHAAPHTRGHSKSYKQRCRAILT